MPDFSLETDKTILRAVDSTPITRLPGFDKKRHFSPDKPNANTDKWIKGLLEAELGDELQALYENCKKHLGMRRADLKKSVDEGTAVLDTQLFRYGVEVGQNPEDPQEAQTIRTLQVRVALKDLPENFDDVFARNLDEIVIPIQGKVDFDDIVARFEDYAEDKGGTLDEDDRTGLIKYTTKEGFCLLVRTHEAELVLRPARSGGCRQLIEDAELVVQSILGKNIKLLSL